MCFTIVFALCFYVSSHSRINYDDYLYSFMITLGSVFLLAMVVLKKVSARQTLHTNGFTPVNIIVPLHINEHVHGRHIHTCTQRKHIRAHTHTHTYGIGYPRKFPMHPVYTLKHLSEEARDIRDRIKQIW